MSKCVFIVEILKSRCNFLTLWGSTCSKKKVGWEVIFSELGFAGSGARKPRREFEGSALEPFFHVFLSLNGVFIVQLNYHIKASVKLMTFVRKNQIIPWQGVYFFINTVIWNLQYNASFSIRTVQNVRVRTLVYLLLLSAHSYNYLEKSTRKQQLKALA